MNFNILIPNPNCTLNQNQYNKRLTQTIGKIILNLFANIKNSKQKNACTNKEVFVQKKQKVRPAAPCPVRKCPPCTGTTSGPSKKPSSKPSPPRRSIRLRGGRLAFSIIKLIIAGSITYSSICMGVWGSRKQTNELYAKIEKLTIKDEFAKKYQEASDYVANATLEKTKSDIMMQYNKTVECFQKFYTETSKMIDELNGSKKK